MKELSINMSSKNGASLILTKKPNYEIEIEIFNNSEISTISFSQTEIREFMLLAQSIFDVRVEDL